MTRIAPGLVVSLCLSAALGVAAGAIAASEKKLKVISETTAKGYAFPESVAYDPKNKVLYMSQFGGDKLDPAAKDGNGRISKLSLEGKVIEDRFLPAGDEKMNKPKGIWVKGNRLWVTDIDSVWLFDLKTKKHKRLELTGITFANDPTVIGNSLYVSDNRADKVYRVEPADFLNSKANPQISVVLAGKSIFPNGLYPGKHGSLLLGGFQSPKDPKGIYSLDKHGTLTEIAKSVGRIDGLYQMGDGSIIATNWDNGSLFRWSEKGGMEQLATGFKGPADFTVATDRKGMTVFVPDLPASELRIIKLAK